MAWSLLSPGTGALAEMSQLPLLELSLYLCLREVEELPHSPASPVGTLCWDLSCVSWYSGEHLHFSVWIWVQALLAKLMTSPVQLPHGTSMMCIMSCVLCMHHTAFLCKCHSTPVHCKLSLSSPQGQILPRSLTLC